MIKGWALSGEKNFSLLCLYRKDMINYFYIDILCVYIFLSVNVVLVNTTVLGEVMKNILFSLMCICIFVVTETAVNAKEPVLGSIIYNSWILIEPDKNALLNPDIRGQITISKDNKLSGQIKTIPFMRESSEEYSFKVIDNGTVRIQEGIIFSSRDWDFSFRSISPQASVYQSFKGELIKYSEISPEVLNYYGVLVVSGTDERMGPMKKEFLIIQPAAIKEAQTAVTKNLETILVKYAERKTEGKKKRHEQNVKKYGIKCATAIDKGEVYKGMSMDAVIESRGLIGQKVTKTHDDDGELDIIVEMDSNQDIYYFFRNGVFVEKRSIDR